MVSKIFKQIDQGDPILKYFCMDLGRETDQSHRNIWTKTWPPSNLWICINENTRYRIVS